MPQRLKRVFRMKLLKGVIDRFEGKTAVILVENLSGFKEGEAVVVNVKRDANKTAKNQKKVKNLLRKIIKEE